MSPDGEERTQGHDDRTATARVLNDVKMEREVQRSVWGNAHDDGHASGDFASLVKGYANRVDGDDERYDRARFVEVAALAVAAIERIDRRGAS